MFWIAFALRKARQVFVGQPQSLAMPCAELGQQDRQDNRAVHTTLCVCHTLVKSGRIQVRLDCKAGDCRCDVELVHWDPLSSTALCAALSLGLRQLLNVLDELGRET